MFEEQPQIDLELHEFLGKAAEQWIALTGVKPNAKQSNLGSYEINKTYKELKEAQKLDPTGLTTAMMLRAFVEEYTNEITFTANEILNDWESVKKIADQMKKLIATLEQPAIKEPTDAFMDWLKRATAHYKIDDEDLGNLLSDPFLLAFIRRDALLAMKKLKAHQFSYGEPEKNPIRYNEKVLQFWNINSLIAAVAHSPESCVTLSLIRDQEATFSYFVFAIRNGGNVIILTDKTKDAHPHKRYMSRSRGKQREFESRAFQFHFPYHFLEMEYLESGDMIIPDQKGIVRYNQEAIVLGRMNKLQAAQMIWLTMMLSMIHETYWKNNKQLPEPSYTAEMVLRPMLLEDQTRHLPAVRNKIPNLPILNSTDISEEKLIEEGQWDQDPVGENKWMEDKYDEKVDDRLLNFIGPLNRLLPLEEQTIPPPSDEKDDGRVSLIQDIRDREAVEARCVKGVQWDKNGLPVVVNTSAFAQHGVIYEKQLSSMNPTDFGTIKELKRDAKWHGRYNKALLVAQAAYEEYMANKDEVVAWFKEHVLANQSKLIEYVARMELKSTLRGHFSHKGFDVREDEGISILQVHYRPTIGSPFWNSAYCSRGNAVVQICDHIDKYRSVYYCAVTGRRANIFSAFRIETPSGIAAVCGCNIEDLPIWLQHYYTQKLYGGNSILSRLDPMDWAIDNPWKALKFGVHIALAKNYFNQLRKELGLPLLTQEQWKEIEKKN